MLLRDSYRGMPEQNRNAFDGNACEEQFDGEGIAELIAMGIRNSGTLE
jgi:hypothetical protein